MIQYTLKMRLVPWDDVAFQQTVWRICDELKRVGVRLDSRDAAALAARAIKAAGYEDATVDYSRGVDEALTHVAHWIVCRDGQDADEEGVDSVVSATPGLTH